MSKKKNKKFEQDNYCIAAIFADNQGHSRINRHSAYMHEALVVAVDRHAEIIEDMKKEHNVDTMFLAVAPEDLIVKTQFNVSKWINKTKSVTLCSKDKKNATDPFLILRGKTCIFIVPVVCATKMNLATNITITTNNEEIDNEQKEEEK